jgi:hypothetical protein
MDKVTLREGLHRLADALCAVARLPHSLRVDAEAALSYALSEATDLAELAQLVGATGPTQISGIHIIDDGCVLRHLILSVDTAGWPTLEPVEGPTVYVGPDLLECYRAAAALAAAPAVLLADTPGSGRVSCSDAATILQVLRSPWRQPFEHVQMKV